MWCNMLKQLISALPEMCKCILYGSFGNYTISWNFLARSKWSLIRQIKSAWFKCILTHHFHFLNSEKTLFQLNISLELYWDNNVGIIILIWIWQKQAQTNCKHTNGIDVCVCLCECEARGIKNTPHYIFYSNFRIQMHKCSSASLCLE